jgi:ribosomal protein S12 methylthiotransferase
VTPGAAWPAPPGRACSLRLVAPRRFWVETLGCAKNAVDSDKVTGALLADGLERAPSAADADLVVVNTCAFIEAARAESVEVLLGVAAAAKPGARVVATGCLAERHGAELAAAMPEVDVVGFAGAARLGRDEPVPPPVSISIGPRRGRASRSSAPRGGPADLLELPRPAPSAPWAYLKVAEGCDRACAFCAIPSFRGPQVSREPDAIEAEARQLVAAGVREIVLVAQDLAWYGRDAGSPGALAPLLHRIDTLRADGLERVRLLYLYPSELRGALLDAMLGLDSVVAYFDLSLQHASRPLLARMKRWGSGEQFLDLIARIRAARPDATFRSSFISGFPGETETMHEELGDFLDAAQLDWAGLFAFSREIGTAADALDAQVPVDVTRARLDELERRQGPITRAARAALVGASLDVLIDGNDDDGRAVGRSRHEAPEIDGVVRITGVAPPPGTIVGVRVEGVDGYDLEAVVEIDEAQPLGPSRRAGR